MGFSTGGRTAIAGAFGDRPLTPGRNLPLDEPTEASGHPRLVGLSVPPPSSGSDG